MAMCTCKHLVKLFLVSLFWSNSTGHFAEILLFRHTIMIILTFLLFTYMSPTVVTFFFAITYSDSVLPDVLLISGIPTEQLRWKFWSDSHFIWGPLPGLHCVLLSERNQQVKEGEDEVLQGVLEHVGTKYSHHVLDCHSHVCTQGYLWKSGTSCPGAEWIW